MEFYIREIRQISRTITSFTSFMFTLIHNTTTIFEYKPIIKQIMRRRQADDEYILLLLKTITFLILHVPTKQQQIIYNLLSFPQSRHIIEYRPLQNIVSMEYTAMLIMPIRIYRNVLHLNKDLLIACLLYILMEDISEVIPNWQPQPILQALKKNPLDPKALKHKLERIYMISSYNEQEYLPDVRDAYNWIRLANTVESLDVFLENERVQKYFLEDFVHTAIRYMILCRKFKLKQMMILTQYMMVEGMKLFVKFFSQIEKYPKMSLILKHTFDIEKQFYKINYTNEYPYLLVAPSEQEVFEIDAFIDSLSVGDRVDILKSQIYSKRLCWLPGTVKKLTAISVYVLCDHEKNSYSFDRKSMQVRPFQSKKVEYQWRLNLKAEDQVDFMNDSHTWVHTVVEQRRQNEDTEDENIKYIEVKVRGCEDWISVTDARIQLINTAVLEGGYNRYASAVVDDFNDLIFDPEMKQKFIVRPQATKSMLFIKLLNYAEEQLKIFDLILQVIQEKSLKIEIVSDLLFFVSFVSPLFHKKYAQEYLNKITNAILDFINNSKEETIRNFSKERFEAVYNAINSFLKRLKPATERKQIAEKFQLELILRFLFSDFLDKKLQAVTLLTSFFRQCNQNITQRSRAQYIQWIRANKILPAIYNEKNHSELISRSESFLKYYLMSDPPAEELKCLLVWNQTWLKLLSEYFEELPHEIQVEVIKKIKERQNVTNPDALSIIKKTENCEEWLLKNGGECWVEVARDKMKRELNLEMVFEQPFNVVMKITREVEDLYDCSLKTYFFTYLFENGYVEKVLSDQKLSLENKLDFSSLTLSLLKKIPDQIFMSLMPFIVNADDTLPSKFKTFFLNIQSKLSFSHINKIFEATYANEEHLQTMGLFQFKLFQVCFLKINEQNRNIDRKIKQELISPHSFRKEKKEYFIIWKNPNELIGMDRLLYIVFQNHSLEVTMDAIKFISFIFKNLAEELKGSIAEFEKTFLENCLKELYKVSEDSPQNTEQNRESREVLQTNYLKILEQVMSQSEVKGTDQEPCVNALFPLQKVHLRVIDHFNVNKSRILLEVPSNWNMYELKVQIGKTVNAYAHEMRIMLNGKQLEDKYNGHIIHTLDLSSDLVIEKKVDVPKVMLTEVDGRLVEKAKRALERIFKEYSTSGMMSKKQCKKYHQKCAGENSYSSDTSVDRIYDEYDKDNDGYLSLADFLGFYEDSARTRESTVWQNLETFGVRNDLDFLDDISIEYVEKQKLTKYLLFENNKFMKILFSLLSSDNEKLVKAAWSLLGRLPLYKQFDLQPDTKKEYVMRYWLYVIDERKDYGKLTSEIMKQVLKYSTETVCVGLKVAQSSTFIDEDIFKTVFNTLAPLSSHTSLSFHNKVILDNGLKILEKCLQEESEKVKAHYLQNQDHYNTILRNGIMSVNSQARIMYCNCIEDIIHKSIDTDFKVFESLFNLIYRIFDKCDKSTLTIEYFDLFTSLLEILRAHEQAMDKLNLNWEILTKEMISLYKSHECTEASMNSKPDQVAQGFLRIMSKLLNNETCSEIVELVPYIFQSSLFPENGKNKLKNSKSRQDAYDLIYQICKFKGENQQKSKGLMKLFEAGFKAIYKKMSTKKSFESYSYYYYSYNEARSELGYAGIRNLGCICYMISMLQQFYMTVPFRHLVLMAEDGEPECLVKKGTKQVDDNLYHQFRDMFAHLLLTEKQEYNPEDFCFAFKDFEGQPMNVSVQQDAQEFLNLFFDKIETSLKNTPFRHVLENIYGGKTCSQMVCSGCGATKERTQNFYPFSLSIKGFKNVYQSLSNYIEGEVIQDYQCDSCKNKCDVTKRNFLQKTPNFFVVHLQRMCFNYDKFENEKVNSRYEFPHELNVYDYTLSKEKGIPEQNQEFTYKLRGVVLHYGTADFGHYFSYIKESQNTWLEFNDERVRQLDPNDIELECFGGQHWRRQSQNAYLLVYEREKKSTISLSFKDDQEKQMYLKNFKLENALVDLSQDKKTSSLIEDMTSKENLEESDIKEKEEQEKEPEKTEKRVEVALDMHKIPLVVPKPVKEKIQKQNDEFSFTMNLSNEEFAQFIYHILSIDPPENLKTEFLELCYETFHLKQMVSDEEDRSVEIAEWASVRFKELIDGHGLEFLKNFGKNWDSDIVSIQKSTRTVTKSLLACVVSDIIKTNSLNDIDFQSIEDNNSEQFKEKTQVIIEFLDRLAEMMLNEIVKHWQRIKEYFQLWMALVSENKFVRYYCQKNMFIDRILDFVMENNYPYERSQKRYPMGSQYYSPEFQFPLQLMHNLLALGYKLCDREERCLSTYPFMDKVIGFRFEGGDSLIPTICQGNRILSEQMAYLLLSAATKISHSDQAKPIISSMHEFLNINDDIKNDRFNWLLGFPVFIEHDRTGSYGSYGIYPDSDSAVTFVSPVGAMSILELIVRIKNKTAHTPALFISMLLQLEKDGLLYNLDEYPSYNSFEQCYSSWLGKFVTNYYEDNHRPYTYHSYIEYANRLKRLWDERPNRPLRDAYPRYIIGKTIDSVQVKENQFAGIFTVQQYDVKSNCLPFTPQLKKTNLKLLRKCKTSTNFIWPNLPEKMTVYSHTRTSNYMRLQSSEEQDQTEENPCETIFANTLEATIIRKVEIINKSSESLLIVIHVKGDENCNAHIPKTPVRLQIKGESLSRFSLVKKNVELPFGEIEVDIEILGRATISGYWPKHIITKTEEKVEEDQDSSGEEDSDTYY